MKKINIVNVIRYIVRRLNVYSRPGLLLRIFLDLLVSNGGMFLGTLFTIIIWNDSSIIHRDYFKVMFFQTWLGNVPLVTLSCLVGYTMTGLYGVTRENRLRKILLAVALAVTTALFIYTLLLYFSFTYIPRSMFFVGWIIKSLIIRYGGATIYKKARPFFLGLILGEFSAAILWSILSYILGVRSPNIAIS